MDLKSAKKAPLMMGSQRTLWVARWTSCLDLWLLLSGAMNASATCRNGVDIDLHHFTAGEHSLQFAFGRSVRLCIAKLGINHGTITNIEIDVAGCKIVARKLVSYLGRCLQHDHLQFSPLGICGCTQYLQMAFCYRVIEGLRIRVISGDDHSRARKAGIKIRVPIRDVFALDARQPENFLQAQQPL